MVRRNDEGEAQRRRWTFYEAIMIKFWGMILVVVSILLTQGLLGEAMGNSELKISLPSEIEGWKWDGKEETYDPQTIFDYINGAGELYRSYNFQRVRVRQYAKGSLPPITTEIYDMGSSEKAYGIFSFERQDEEAKIGQGSEFGGGLLRFWKGQYLVSVYSEGDSPEIQTTILKIGREIARSIKSEGPLPPMLNLLPGPEFGLQERSIRILPNHVLLNKRFFVANENILRLGSETEIVLDQFNRNQKRLNLLLIRYPKDMEAGSGMQSFKKAYMPEAGAKDRIKTEDHKWTLARRYKNFVHIVFGALTEADGDELLRATEEKVRGRAGEWKKK